jgi:hypothetical protein
MSRLSKAVLALGSLVLLWFAQIAWDYFDLNSPANLAMLVQLKLFGAAMYEYQSHAGRWPTKIDDLAQTSLPAQSNVWRQTANTTVFLWPQGLKPEPKDNANVLLAYWRGGLYKEFGRVWACWGDVRIKRIKRSQLPTAEQK